LPGKKSRKRQQGAGPEEETTRVWRGFTLNPFQVRSFGTVDRGDDLLLSAPTGAGKTLVAEYAVEKAMEDGRKAIYTAPIKALSNQKFRDFRAILGDQVGLMTGDLTLNPGAPLLIMTTEIFRNTIFERSVDLDAARYVIFDEIHFMDDPERGTVWEESIIFAPPHIRFICLSATVSNLNQFGEWIETVRDSKIETIRSTDRPVPLTHYLFFPDHGPTRADRVKKFPRRHGRRRPRINRSHLLDRLEREGRLPILYFCFSRKECEKRARENRRRGLLNREERERMSALFSEICDSYVVEPDAALLELKSLVLQGVGYHHAGLLPQHKEIVERLFTAGMLKLLFTTETFALGINMPARTVIFSSLRKFNGVGFDTLMTREYQQMAGRAGRQGIDTEGLVYSILEDDRVSPGDVRRLLSNDVEPIRSRFNLSYNTLINLHTRLGGEIFDAWEKSFNNFQWKRTSRKKRERNRNKQVSLIRKRLAFLREAGYIREVGMTDKGQAAALINGYELQAVEIIHSGLLDRMSEIQIVVVVSAIVFEERKRDLFRRMDRSVLGPLRREAEECIDEMVNLERSFGIRSSLARLNFKCGAVMHAWCRGLSFTDIEEYTNCSRGDLVRTFRLTVQLLRQIRKAMPSNPALHRKLGTCIEIINRDEVDALRQLQA